MWHVGGEPDTSSVSWGSFPSPTRPAASESRRCSHREMGESPTTDRQLVTGRKSVRSAVFARRSLTRVSVERGMLARLTTGVSCVRIAACLWHAGNTPSSRWRFLSRRPKSLPSQFRACLARTRSMGQREGELDGAFCSRGVCATSRISDVGRVSHSSHSTSTNESYLDGSLPPQMPPVNSSQ